MRKLKFQSILKRRYSAKKLTKFQLTKEIKEFIELCNGIPKQVRESAGIALPFYKDDLNLEIICKLYYLCDKNLLEFNALNLWANIVINFENTELGIIGK